MNFIPHLTKVNLFTGGIMKLLLFAIITFLFVSFTRAQILEFAQANRQTQPMNVELMTFIAETLHAGKPALNLDCEVRMREIKQDRKFSDGVKAVEMLEIIYRGAVTNPSPQKAYFPIGSVVIREQKVSAFAGTVEEIQLEAGDLANSRFTFQHNGRGEIVSMSFEDDLKTLPCRLKAP